MRKSNYRNYDRLSSFDDIRFERKRLTLKGKLLESRISIELGQIRDKFSLTTLTSTFARAFFLPKVSGLLGAILRKIEDKD
jgi:hypothetical protein